MNISLTHQCREYIAIDMGICFDTSPVMESFVSGKFDNCSVPKYEHELSEQQKKKYYWLLSDFKNRK